MANTATKKEIKNYRLLRAELNMNQHQFWSRIGVTQSGGSRYESGRDVPAPTKELAFLAYAKPQHALEALARIRETTVEELIASAKQ